MSGELTALVLQHDLLRILAGHTMTVRTEDDQGVRIRMYWADEFLIYQHRMVDEHPEMGGSKITLAQAEEQTRHWDLERMLRDRLERGVWDATKVDRVFDEHSLRLIDAPKMDARDFVRAVCSCGGYTSDVDTPSGATRAWVAHWTAKTRGAGR